MHRYRTIWALSTSCALGVVAPIGRASADSGPSASPGDGPWYLAPDQRDYRVEPLASSFRVSLVFAPVPGAGIASYGVTLKFDADSFEAARPGIEIPAGLDFNGFAGPGALTEIGPGFVSVKGTVDFLGQAVVRYDAPLVVSIILAPKDALPGETSVLSLEPYYTAGPNEALFVDGDGRVLDPDIVFGSATVEFIPEPSTRTLLALGVALLATRHRQPKEAAR